MQIKIFVRRYILLPALATITTALACNHLNEYAWKENSPETADIAEKFINKLAGNTPLTIEDENIFFGSKLKAINKEIIKKFPQNANPPNSPALEFLREKLKITPENTNNVNYIIGDTFSKAQTSKIFVRRPYDAKIICIIPKNNSSDPNTLENVNTLTLSIQLNTKTLNPIILFNGENIFPKN